MKDKRVGLKPKDRPLATTTKKNKWSAANDYRGINGKIIVYPDSWDIFITGGKNAQS